MGVMNFICYSSMALEMAGFITVEEDGLMEKMRDTKIKEEGIPKVKLSFLLFLMHCM
jgi:hypothetical protein